MSIGASTVKELREKTGCGFMDCKAALEQSGGDLEAAVEYLRKKGLAAAAKKADRKTGEGVVETCLLADGRVGAIVEVNCETDFVARTDDFRALVRDVAAHAAEAGGGAADAEAMLGQPFAKDPARTVKDVLGDAVGRIGENMRVARFARFALEGEGVVGSYIHPGSKIGVLVEVSTSGIAASAPELQALVKDLAMQVAAASPLAVDPAGLPADVVAKEREIYAEQAKASGKPEKIVEKMVEGRLKKYYEESCLLEQRFIKDQDRAVKDVVAQVAKALGGSVAVRRFARFQLGGR